jgi:hypothetical protein
MDANGCKNPLKQHSFNEVCFVNGPLKPSLMRFRPKEECTVSYERAQINGLEHLEYRLSALSSIESSTSMLFTDKNNWVISPPLFCAKPPVAQAFEK